MTCIAVLINKTFPFNGFPRKNCLHVLGLDCVYLYFAYTVSGCI